jgi:hypothetical protein
MYSRFNLTLDESDFAQMRSDTSTTYFLKNSSAIAITEQEKKIKRVLDDLLLENGDLSAEKMWEQWFRQLSNHVFISHSHQDEENAKMLADWLFQKFGIKSFIDSMVWGYANDLLKDIDNKYCKGDRYYDYDKRNISTTHVHMVLSSALTMMLDNTECIIFLNTPNSINLENNIEGNTTYSPWIFNELLASKLLQRKSIEEHRPQISLEEAVYTEDSMPKVKYPVSLGHLSNLDYANLIEWRDSNKSSSAYTSLDTLYQLKNIPQFQTAQLLSWQK